MTTRTACIGIRPAGQDSEIFTRETKYGIKIDSVLIYQKVKTLSFANVKALLDKGKSVQLVLEFVDTFANLDAIVKGDYDTYLKTFAAMVKQDGRPLWIRPLHEFNGNWYSWCIFTVGNSVNSFIAAWKHIVTLFRTAGATNVKFQLNYNCTNANNDTTVTFKQLYPGDDYVDAIGASCYNRTGLDKWHTQFVPFSTLFQPVYTKLAELSTTKPLFVGEMSTTSYNGDKAAWITQAFDATCTLFPRVQTVNWFLQNKIENSFVADWDLNSVEQEQAWVKGVTKFRSAVVVSLVS